MINESPEERDRRLTEYILTDYAEKKKKGVITFETDGANIVLVHKQFDAFGTEIDPMKLPFTPGNLARIRIQRGQQRDQLEMQKIALEEQLNALDMQNSTLYAQLEADVTRKAEEAKTAKK